MLVEAAIVIPILMMIRTALELYGSRWPGSRGIEDDINETDNGEKKEKMKQKKGESGENETRQWCLPPDHRLHSVGH